MSARSTPAQRGDVPRSTIPVNTSLAGKVGRTATTADDLKAMAVAAWHKRGVAMIRLDDLPNEFDRLAVEAIANTLYGRRTESE